MTLGQTLILLFLRNILGGLDQPATNPVSFQEVAGRRTISMRLKNGSATVPGAPSRRPAEWPWQQILSLFSGVSQGSDAFGETPKAAGEDARAPQSFCVVSAKGRQDCLPHSGHGSTECRPAIIGVHLQVAEKGFTGINRCC